MYQIIPLDVISHKQFDLSLSNVLKDIPFFPAFALNALTFGAVSSKLPDLDILQDLRYTYFIASQEINAASKRHLCDMQFNDVAVALKS